MGSDNQPDPHIYRIGAVSRLTSIPTGTIRVWERRYGVVEPGRSEGGFRLYSHRDVERLRVIKSLIENGETISGLANLSLDQLKQRLRAHGIALPEPLQHPLDVELPNYVNGSPLPGAGSTAEIATDSGRSSGRAVDEPPTELYVDAARGASSADATAMGVEAVRNESSGLTNRNSPEQNFGRTRIVVAGESVAVAMRLALTAIDGVQLVGTRPSWREEAELARFRPDLVVLEQPSIHVETADELNRVVRGLGTRHALVVYQFGSEAALRSLESERITPIKGPLTPTQLQLALRLALERSDNPPPGQQAQRFIESVDQRPPPARFDPATIARIAAQSRVVHCECPQHLATLISSLMAFESYCRECEHRSEDDAALHSALERSTGQARATLEDALDYLLQVENIVP